MQNPSGQIISVSTDPADQTVIVEVSSDLNCKRCAAGKGCGAGLLGSRPSERRVEAVVADHLEVRNGDRVSIVLEPANVLRAAIIIYAYPLIAAMLAAVSAHAIGLSDIAAAIATLIGLGAGIYLAKLRLRSAGCLREFTPMVVARLPEVAH